MVLQSAEPCPALAERIQAGDLLGTYDKVLQSVALDQALIDGIALIGATVPSSLSGELAPLDHEPKESNSVEVCPTML